MALDTGRFSPMMSFGQRCHCLANVPEEVHLKLCQRMPTATSYTFTHCDLTNVNIIADNGNLAGILDWESSGYFPSWWKFTGPSRLIRSRSTFHCPHKNQLPATGSLLTKELSTSAQGYWKGIYLVSTTVLYGNPRQRQAVHDCQEKNGTKIQNRCRTLDVRGRIIWMAFRKMPGPDKSVYQKRTRKII